MLKAEEQITARTKFWTIAGILISWLTFWIFIFSPFGLVAWIGILIYLIIKRSKLTGYILLSAWLFVPSCSFLRGTVRYATGSATILGVGGPILYDGIDQETRVPTLSSGCIFVGYEPFVFPANNSAIKLCTDLFGFQRGAYTGVFPTEKEAKEILASGDTIVVKQVDTLFQFNTHGQVVSLDFSDLHRSTFETDDTVLGKTITNECFVFRKLYKEEEQTEEIYIVDIHNKKIVEIYSDY